MNLGLNLIPGGLRPQGDPTAAIAGMFASGEQGVWYDPSDFSTLFQDAAGTIPVTAAGQPVGLLLDKSGRGNHATQSTDASRPVLQQDTNGQHYLQFDGVDDSLRSSSVNLSAESVAWAFLGLQSGSDATVQSYFDHGNPTPLTGNLSVFSVPSQKFRFRCTYVVSADLVEDTLPHPAPFRVVTACRFAPTATTPATESVQPRVNGQAPTIGVLLDAAESTSLLNAPVSLGIRSDNVSRANCRIYGVIFRARDLTLPQVQAAERYLNQRTRAY